MFGRDIPNLLIEQSSIIELAIVVWTYLSGYLFIQPYVTSQQ